MDRTILYYRYSSKSICTHVLLPCHSSTAAEVYLLTQLNCRAVSFAHSVYRLPRLSYESSRKPMSILIQHTLPTLFCFLRNRPPFLGCSEHKFTAENERNKWHVRVSYDSLLYLKGSGSRILEEARYISDTKRKRPHSTSVGDQLQLRLHADVKHLHSPMVLCASCREYVRHKRSFSKPLQPKLTKRVAGFLGHRPLHIVTELNARCAKSFKAKAISRRNDVRVARQ